MVLHEMFSCRQIIVKMNFYYYEEISFTYAAEYISDVHLENCFCLDFSFGKLDVNFPSLSTIFRHFY